MRDTDWANVLSESNAQKAYSTFYSTFSQLYNTHFPIKTIKIGYKNRKPWLSSGLKKSIKMKNKLYKRKNKTKKPEHEAEYKF